MSPQMARVVDIVSDRVVFEQDITNYSEADKQTWFATVARMFDIPVMRRIEWPDHFEERDV